MLNSTSELNGHPQEPELLQKERLTPLPETKDRSSIEVGRGGSPSIPSVLDNTLLVLDPVEPDAGIRRGTRRTKRPKRIIVDDDIILPRENMRARIANASDTIAPRELRFISKYHAEMQRLSSVKVLFSTPCQKWNSESFKKVRSSFLFSLFNQFMLLSF